MKEKQENKKITDPVIKSANEFPVVGIGASAGGFEAFKKLLKAISKDSGMAYVLVQHLDPTHESMLSELLQKVTNIPVLEITDDIKVEPNHIYVIPSNKIMTATNGVLLLSQRPSKSKKERFLPIDLFFTSLAEVHQSHAIGVVLSGTATDGTLGLKAIKERGGITFAQDEISAAYGGMPQSARNEGVVDFILPPEEIPAKLLEVTSIINGKKDKKDKNQNADLSDEEVIRQVLSLLRIRKGTDFTYYKQSTIRRRILRRMVINKKSESIDYLNYLIENKTEQDLLYNDLLIPVTSFFRDSKVFDNLCETVLPNIVKDKSKTDPIRIWIAACSTGEEAYSIAICMKEFLANNQHHIQIFATDISDIAIKKARNGIYTKKEIETVSPQRLQEFYSKINGHYQVNKSIRDLCVFAHHNFLKDPPFVKMDFISCRNVLIYMEPYLQKKALNTFHYSLNTNGLLLLGKSETTSVVPKLFTIAAKGDKIYSRNDIAGNFIHEASQRTEHQFNRSDTKSTNETIRNDFQKTADDIILRHYTPAGVVVNEGMDIVHFRGNTSNYLEQSSGKPTHNLLQMAKNGLAFELRNILHKAKKCKTRIIKENITIDKDGALRRINVEAIPLPNLLEPHYLILFHDNNANDNKQGARGNKKLTTLKGKENEKDLRISQLENELSQAREDMQSITEDQEAANEELQSANEELLSSSEELQSLNEELETGQEELQSTNEELMIVNRETINLNEQLTASRNYADSIIATIREPLLVLDKHLRIQIVNKAFYNTFQVNEKDTEGRFIYELGDQQWNNPQLIKLLGEILPNRTPFANFEIRYPFPNIGKRIMLINGREILRDHIEDKLILVSIEDVTEKMKLQDEEKKLLARFQYLLLEAPLAIMVLKGEDYIVELANSNYLQLIDKEDGFIGKPIFESMPEWNTQGIRKLFDKVIQSGIPYYGYEQELKIFRNKKIEQGFYNVVYHPIKEPDGTATGIIVVATKVTEEVLSRKKIEVQSAMIEDMLMTAPAFIATLIGPEHVFELVNERYQRVFGNRELKDKSMILALPELKGQGFIDLLDKVYKSGKAYVGVEIPMHLAVDKSHDLELRYFNFSYQAMYNENKKIYGILVFGYDVTEQVIAKNKNIEDHFISQQILEKKVEARTYQLNEANKMLHQKNKEVEEAKAKLMSEYARNLIESSLDPLVVISPFGKITDMNQATIKITGVNDENLKGTNFFDYFTEPKKAQEVYKEVFEKGFVTNYPLTIQHVDGKLTDVFLNGSVYKDANADIVGVVLVARDVTEQKKASKALTEAIIFAEKAAVSAEEAKLKAEQAAYIAEDAVKSKQQFLSNMSHEIRTPMNAIIGFTKVIQKTDLNTKQREYLNAIKLSGNSLIVLINDILDLAKVESGKMTFEKIPFQLSSSISAMTHLFETKIQEKNLQLVIEFDDAIPKVILGDPVRLHQIILNLVSNAVKFTDSGKITVSVRLVKEDEEKVEIEFSVMDTGIGIEADYFESIFDNFSQASSGTSRLYGGTGLGLAIVKKLVEAQEGSISVKSKVNEGSNFSFLLNFKKTKMQDVPETAVLKLDSDYKKIKVLVVEDMALNQLLMKTILDDFGFERDIAANGRIAIEKMTNKSYDIILMDLQMPEMNGFEATKYIRNNLKSEIPIIALTADVTTVDLAKCKAVGMNDYIAKPVDEQILYSKIIGLVKKPEQNNLSNSELSTTEQVNLKRCTNLSYLNRITKSNPALIMEMIAIYLEQTPLLINNLKKALEDKEWSVLNSVAHRMVPSFLILGIDPEYELMVKKIQKYSGNMEDSNKIEKMVAEVVMICEKACKELEEEYNSLKYTNS